MLFTPWVTCTGRKRKKGWGTRERTDKRDWVQCSREKFSRPACLLFLKPLKRFKNTVSYEHQRKPYSKDKCTAQGRHGEIKGKCLVSLVNKTMSWPYRCCFTPEAVVTKPWQRCSGVNKHKAKSAGSGYRIFTTITRRFSHVAPEKRLLIHN